MIWNQRLAQARKDLGLRQEEVIQAMRAFLPQSEWVRVAALSSWEQGRTQPKVQQALALATIYGMDPCYLFGTPAMGAGLNEAGQVQLSQFRQLLLDSPRYRAKEPSRAVRLLPVYLQPASAGTGQWLDDDIAEQIEVDDSVPAAAQFGVRLAGDSMTPRFADGQIVWAKSCTTAENGSIVLCVLNGQGYCKKLRREEDGVTLVSLNSAYTPIPVKPEDDFQIMGVVVG